MALVVSLALAAGALWLALTPPAPLAATADDFALGGVTLVEPSVSRRAGVSLLVRGGRIAEIRIGGPPADRLAELDGTFVLPGLVDMHAHLPPANALRLGASAALLYLAHGVTSIRDVGDTDGTAVPAAREGIEGGEYPGPRLFSCGPFVAGAEPARWANTEIVREPADAEPIVARIAKAGHVCVKSYEDLDVARIEALKAAARRHGLRVIGHVPTALGYEEALVPEVQHFFGVPPPSSLARDSVLERSSNWGAVDAARLEFIVKVTLEHDIANTPTLVSGHQLLLFRDYPAARESLSARLLPRLYSDVVWSPEGGLPFWRGVERYLDPMQDALAKKADLLRRLHRAGARLYLGTDAQQPFVAPGLGLQQEMGHFVAAGIPVEDVWSMATWGAARKLGVPGLGRLDPGSPADFLVFRRDPTRDLGQLATLAAVVAQGRLYTRADLDRAGEAYRRHYRGLLVDRLSIAAARYTLSRTVQRDY